MKKTKLEEEAKLSLNKQTLRQLRVKTSVKTGQQVQGSQGVEDQHSDPWGR